MGLGCASGIFDCKNISGLKKNSFSCFGVVLLHVTDLGEMVEKFFDDMLSHASATSFSSGDESFVGDIRREKIYQVI